MKKLDQATLDKIAKASDDILKSTTFGVFNPRMRYIKGKLTHKPLEPK